MKRTGRGRNGLVLDFIVIGFSGSLETGYPGRDENFVRKDSGPHIQAEEFAARRQRSGLTDGDADLLEITVLLDRSVERQMWRGIPVAEVV